jgi:hypothetical protein
MFKKRVSSPSVALGEEVSKNEISSPSVALMEEKKNQSTAIKMTALIWPTLLMYNCPTLHVINICILPLSKKNVFFYKHCHGHVTQCCYATSC